VYTVKHPAIDPWKAVARRCELFVSTASSQSDPRGAFVGVAIRPPAGEGDADPVAMQRATESDEFLVELIALLARWRILR